jgi:hypothetical protein
MAEELYLAARRLKEKLALQLYCCESRSRNVLATLSPVPLTRKGQGPAKILPADRVRAWEELARWIVYLVITPDPVVQEGEYQNRLKAENWAHGHGEQPQEDKLYDWRTDQAALERLRPRYARVIQKMCQAVGRPSQKDFELIYPNRYKDEWLSDQTRQALRDLRALFGPEVIMKD